LLERTRRLRLVVISGVIGGAPLSVTLGAKMPTTAKAKIAIAATIVALLGACGYCAYQLCTERELAVERYIGTFTSRDAAVSKSLKRLSQEMQRHPTNELYSISFYYKKRAGYHSYGATLYDRKLKQIGFEFDPGSGFVAKWTNVDYVAIQAAAATNGVFEGFGRAAWLSTGYDP
jgi:hypothetical protein